jgi:hypothetical protein
MGIGVDVTGQQSCLDYFQKMDACGTGPCCPIVQCCGVIRDQKICYNTETMLPLIFSYIITIQKISAFFYKLVQNNARLIYNILPKEICGRSIRRSSKCEIQLKELA